MGWTLEEIPELRGYTVEWAEEGNYYLSRRNRVYRSADLSPPFEKTADIPAPGWRRLASNSRLAQRLLRFMVTNIIPLENGELFVTFDKSVGTAANGEYTEAAGLARPTRVLRSACAVEGENIYFGEYLANDERGEMRVYRYTKGEKALSVVHTFKPGSIKHIHGIYKDPVAGSLYCLTGDKPRECMILRTDDGFGSMETVGSGDETWRAVSLQFTEDAIYYGTDAEHRANRIYRLDRVSGERVELGEVNGTVFYSRRMGDELFFATTAENAPAQKENVAAIWHVDAVGNLNEVARFKKDIWHPTLFQFGLIHLAAGPDAGDTLYFHLVGVEGDGRTYSLRRSRAD
jgi:hypothetical protein